MCLFQPKRYDRALWTGLMCSTEKTETNAWECWGSCGKLRDRKLCVCVCVYACVRVHKPRSHTHTHTASCPCWENSSHHYSHPEKTPFLSFPFPKFTFPPPCPFFSPSLPYLCLSLCRGYCRSDPCVPFIAWWSVLLSSKQIPSISPPVSLLMLHIGQRGTSPFLLLDGSLF